MQKKHSLAVLLGVLCLAFFVHLYHELSFNPLHDVQAYRGTDIDSYVNLAINDSYQPFPNENTIHRDTEYPLVFIALYPFVFFGSYFGFAIFMALYATLTGALVFFLAEEIQPESGLFAAWIWLFNPLNYRVFFDLSQQLLATFLGLLLLAVLLVIGTRVYDAKFDKPWIVLLILIAILTLLAHQTGMFWVAAAMIALLMGLVFFLEYTIVAVAALLVLSFVSWRFFIMLAFPVTVALLFAPRKYWPLIATLFLLGYLIAPWIFGAPATAVVGGTLK